MAPEDRHSGLPGGGGGANVKSGSESGIACGSSRAVTFGTAFAATPHATAAIAASLSVTDIVRVFNVSTTGLEIYIHKGHGGSGHSLPVHWIATDAGDP